MKFLFSLSLSILLLGSLISCIKGENYCPQPKGLLGFKAHPETIPATQGITLELNYDMDFNMEIMNNRILFNFSVPTIFENPKGDRGVDVVEQASYFFKLKDPQNAPDSVVIEAYGFNDCGRSEIARTVLRFSN